MSKHKISNQLSLPSLTSNQDSEPNERLSSSLAGKGISKVVQTEPESSNYDPEKK